MNWKKLPSVASIVFIVGAVIAALYLATYFFPMTDNAFVFQKITPVSSQDTGVVTEIYAENGQMLKEGDPIFSIDRRSYQLDYDAAKAQYDQAQQGLVTLDKLMSTTHYLVKAAEDDLAVIRNQYNKKSAPSVKKAVPQIEVQSLAHELSSQKNRVNSLRQQVEQEQSEYEQQLIGMESLKSAMNLAKLRLEETTIVAHSNGYVQNINVGIGTRVEKGIAIGYFVNTDHTFVQANMIETDLAHVKEGDEVLIYPRTYLWHKVYKGLVVSSNKSVNRQISNPVEGSQIVINENKWLLLPQRFPIQIVVEGQDPSFPLYPGMSAYVYIKTKAP